jgi:protocatechuate 3,4-dioxygenase beta subunit
MEITRRRLLEIGLVALPAAALLQACGGSGGGSSGGTEGSSGAPSGSGSNREVTPACGTASELTPEETEGPFFSTGSPERTSLREDGIVGTPLVVAGTVLSAGCDVIADAKLDFWHADDNGEYDNSGYRLRGHQFTDAQGAYRLETIVPGLYPGRTRHIHVKVQAPGNPVLTTQLYFPNEPDNAGDSLFQEVLLIGVVNEGNGRAGSFDFVLDVPAS